jgi:hypothetical protein
LGCCRRDDGGGLTDKFSEKVTELRKTDPLVDWTGVDKGHAEFRRVVKFLSAATE